MRALSAGLSVLLCAGPAGAQGLFDSWASRKANVELRGVTSFTAADLEAGAVREGAVVWYTGTNPLHKDVVAAFQKRFPKIKVEAIHLGGSTIAQRFSADKERGVEKADVFSSGLTEIYPQMRAKGWFADLKSLPHWAGVPVWAKDPRGAYAFFHVVRHCLAVNTDLVPEAERPRSYAELAEPRWKDRVALVDPDTGGMGVYLARFAVANAKLGLDWLAKMRDNGVQLSFQSGQLIEAVASGRRAVGLGRDVEVDDAAKAGAPVKCLFAAEGLPVQFDTVAVNAKAAHPYAARFLVDWLISAEGHEALRRAGRLAPAGETPGASWPGAWILDVESLDAAAMKTFSASISKVLKGS